jgi:hypothetical protein
MAKVKKYRRISKIIEAVEFRPGDEEWPKGVQYDPDGTGFVVWNDFDKSYIKIKAGDFIRMDKPQDRYPIDRETFSRTYEFYSD